MVGKIWADPNKPDPRLSQFPEGTVVAKLLFTTAPDLEAPYLRNTLEWIANIHHFQSPGCPVNERSRQPQKVRLLQIDLAVKDRRAPVTAWVFATLAYDGNAARANGLGSYEAGRRDVGKRPQEQRAMDQSENRHTTAILDSKVV
jgi:hypothetical protein